MIGKWFDECVVRGVCGVSVMKGRPSLVDGPFF